MEKVVETIVVKESAWYGIFTQEESRYPDGFFVCTSGGEDFVL